MDGVSDRRGSPYQKATSVSHRYCLQVLSNRIKSPNLKCDGALKSIAVRFRGERVMVRGVWRKAELLWEQVHNVQLLLEELQGHTPLLKWERQFAPFVKLNVDAGSCSSGGGTISGLLRDETSMCLGAFAEKLSYPDDLVLLEARAMMKGVELACSMQVIDLIVEGDAQIVFDVLNKGNNHASLLTVICESIRTRCHCF
ncbi:endoribonuclease Dicer-like protein 3-like [Senna tora]|uniref:Endoribonuclease Dicer-like protein 3-like n=1 Tax=Senna tora TaxID=362788 RepID=A0A834TZK9_9FABA|nr:endoribonuclease Dicer-like protein 3-like [Senna tora]